MNLFDQTLESHGLPPLARAAVTTLQVNVGRLCNQACHHCHLEAGPRRTEVMPRSVAERLVSLVARNPGIEVVDFTGGAPELNPHFRWMVSEVRRLGRRAIDRSNLTILFEPGQEDLAEFLAARQVHIVASLPCYTRENVDRQRGRGVFEKSLEALLYLNDLGYGKEGSPLRLSLVYNPGGASLPPAQKTLEEDYKRELLQGYGIEFHDLLTMTNMPMGRFAAFLEANGGLAAYVSLLAGRFNPETLPALMCRSMVSVGWNGRLYDCDFNQVLEIGLQGGGSARTVFDLDDLDGLAGRPIATGPLCLGCTAGAGSSCGGALLHQEDHGAAGIL